MIGIIPSSTKTFIVEGYITDNNLEEGKLYIDPDTDLIFMYSLIETRSNPNTGYFPIWNGTDKLVSKFSHKKYLNIDVKHTDIQSLSSNIDKSTAENVLYKQRKSDSNDILRPILSDEDNMFTQCIKGILNSKEYTLIDLVDMAKPKMSEKMVENYYSALTKIAFMRLDKWNIWLDCILHMRYQVVVYRDKKKLLSYDYPSNVFDTGIIKYDSVIDTSDDPFKKIIKILITMENISKNTLRSKEVDDYTINNMLTTLHGDKALSAQLFSRFMRMAKLSYEVHIYDSDGLIFSYGEF